MSSHKVFFTFLSREHILLDLAQKIRSKLLEPSLHMAQTVRGHMPSSMCSFSKVLMLPFG